MTGRLRRCGSVALWLAMAVAAFPASGWAAACCLSASVVGTGRLVVWEEAAAGISTTWSHGVGRLDAQGRWRPLATREEEVRTTPWAMVRLGERLQLSARVPWVVGVRNSGQDTAVGSGLGDVQAGLRLSLWEVGQYAWLPGVALVVTGLAPTGRRPEAATDALGASATGRGVWATGLGLELEYATLPWFGRLDAGVLASTAFRRLDTGVRQQFGPSLQVALSAGRELWPEVLVVGVSLGWEGEAPLSVDGVTIPDSQVRALTASVMASYQLTRHWQCVGSVSTDSLGRLGLAQNREDRVGFSVGVRRGFF